MRKITSIFITLSLLAYQLALPVALYAAPELPTSPELNHAIGDVTVTVPTAPKTPENVKPTPTPAPTPEAQPVANPSPSPQPETAPVKEAEPVAEDKLYVEKPSRPRAPGEEKKTNEEYTGSKSDNNLVGGEAEIKTGDANGAGSLATLGNTNTSAGPQTNSGVGGIAIVNDKNGSDSNNTASASIAEDSLTNQNNDANLGNSLRVEAESGYNSASRNTGTDSTIKTGDANATGTIFNSVNTNIEALVVAEFNIVDDHVGDYVLDFGEGCIFGCQNLGGVSAQNTGNGSDSNNEIDLALSDSSATFQNNDANINNELVLTATSGKNKTNDNTNGDNSIVTGDANASGSVLNFANNNFAGNVVYSVVNVFGDLIGDIIIPESILTALGYGGGANIANTGNRSGSTNLADLEVITLDEFNQFNNAEIVNNLNLDANTGGNSTSDNTGGNNKIVTGDSNVDAQVINIANNNFVGGNWWIVLVNEAGNWVGKIIGLPGTTVGNNYAGSGGTSFGMAENGDINISNQGNGTGSNNLANVQLANQNITNQTNNALIVNDINISANTGDNKANGNTGGNSSIETGDANIMLNLVNFVNNNFAGGNVYLTVVNVFGRFFGDVVTPGAKKEQVAQENKGGIGGAANTTGNSGAGSGGSGGSGGGGSVASSTVEDATATEDVQEVLLVNKIVGKKGVLGSAGVDIEAHASDGDVVSDTVSGNNGRRLNLAYAALLIPGYLLFVVGKRAGVLSALSTLVKKG